MVTKKATKPAPKKAPAAAARKPVSGPSKEEKGEEAPWEGETASELLPPLVTDLDWIVSEEVEERLMLNRDLVIRQYILLLAHIRGMFLSLPPDKTMGMISRYRDDKPGDREGPKTAQLRKMVGG